MTLLGTWGGETPWEIYRTGTPLSEDGDGVIWRCTCPHGEPQGDKEANAEVGYPCKHLRSVWAHACDKGVYDPHVNWTAEGVELGQRCRCRSAEPVALRFGPPIERPPDPEGPALNKPCPCGSGRKFKKCAGFGPGRPDGPAHPLLQPDVVIAVQEASPIPPSPAEEKRREEAEERAHAEEAEAARLAELDRIREEARAADELRRAQRRERDRLRTEALRLSVEETEVAKRAASERLQAKLDEIRAKEEARREARRERRARR